MQREQKAKADTVSDGTSDIWDEDLGGMLSGHLIANKGLRAGSSARNQQREPTREGYLYVENRGEAVSWWMWSGLRPQCNEK